MVHFNLKICLLVRPYNIKKYNSFRTKSVKQDSAPSQGDGYVATLTSVIRTLGAEFIVNTI